MKLKSMCKIGGKVSYHISNIVNRLALLHSVGLTACRSMYSEQSLRHNDHVTHQQATLARPARLSLSQSYVLTSSNRRPICLDKIVDKYRNL